MSKMITKIAKRVSAGSILLTAVALAPRDGCDRLGTYHDSPRRIGFESPEDLLGYGGPDSVYYGGPDTNPLLITDEEH